MPASSSSSSRCSHSITGRLNSARKDSSMKASSGVVGVVDNQNKGEKEKAARYGECRKNHAANIGGYAVDGCREFMASGEEGTSAALRCAACTCHRSFHKRLVDASPSACDCSSDSNS